MLHFAEIFRDLTLRRHLKLPKWLFATSYERKDQASLSATEQGRFLCAYNTLISNGTLGPLVDIHDEPAHMPHSTQRLLPWHRVYLLQLEMHHANLDRLWWQWQNSPQGTGKYPTLSGASAIMDPWALSEVNTRDITTLGHAYV